MTTDQDEVERLRSYIGLNAAKDPAVIHALLQRGHEQLLRLLEGLSEAQAAFKPSADDWSVLEALRHVVGSRHGVARRCAVLARGGASVSFEPLDEAPAFASLTEARQALEAAYDEMLAFIDGLESSRADLEARFEHPVFGPLNCREWAVFLRVHDGDHSGQIEKIKAASGFAKA